MKTKFPVMICTSQIHEFNREDKAPSENGIYPRSRNEEQAGTAKIGSWGSETPSTSPPTVPILGRVLGGATLLSILILISWYLRRWYKRSPPPDEQGLRLDSASEWDKMETQTTRPPGSNFSLPFGVKVQ